MCVCLCVPFCDENDASTLFTSWVVYIVQFLEGLEVYPLQSSNIMLNHL